MLLCAASGGGTRRKRLARLSRDNHVQPNGEDGTEKKKREKREKGNKNDPRRV